MLENADRCANVLGVLQSYCAALRAGRCDNPQRFIWEVEDVDIGIPRGVPESRDHRWRALIAETMRAEGFIYTMTDDGFTLALPLTPPQ